MSCWNCESEFVITILNDRNGELINTCCECYLPLTLEDLEKVKRWEKLFLMKAYAPEINLDEIALKLGATIH